MTDIIERLRDHAGAHEYIADQDAEQKRWMDDLRVAADEIERLRAECDALKKDAARYQFIRAGNAYIEPHDEHEIYVAIEAGKYYTDLRDLDMDIDEAIAAAPKPEE